MVLSIGMIVKNEEKYLPGCLESLKPIMEAVDSELIIFDTGSTDSTVEIAKRYTAHVYHIDWRDDFAWARNHTLDKATGEWFMFFDADEEFMNSEDLISFFTSGEYKKFGVASYRWENLQDKGRISYFHPQRLFKNRKGMRFEGRIHEFIYPKGNYKQLSSVAKHYGYMSTDPEEVKKKTERNLKPLLEMLKENPNDVRSIHHAVTEYFNLKEYDKAMELIDRGIEYVKKPGISSDDAVYFFILYEHRIFTLVNKKEHEEAIKTVREYYSLTPIRFANAVKHKYAEGMSLVHLKRHREAVESFKEALKYFEQNKNGEFTEDIFRIIALDASFIEDNRYIHNTLMNSLAVLGEFDEAWAWRNDNRLNDVKREHLFILYVNNAVTENDLPRLKKLYEYMISSDDLDESERLQIIDKIEETLKSSKAKAQVSAAISETGNDDDYCRLMRLRHFYLTNDEGLEEVLEQFLASGKPYSQTYADVIICAMKKNRDFSAFLENMQVTDSGLFAIQLFNTDDRIDVAHTFLELGLPQRPGIKFMRLMSQFISAVLVNLVSHPKPDNELEASDFEDLRAKFFENAIRLQHRFLRMIYNPFVYSESMVASLSESDAFVYHAGVAFDSLDKGDVLSFVRGLRSAMHINPSMKEQIRHLIERIRA